MRKKLTEKILMAVFAIAASGVIIMGKYGTVFVNARTATPGDAEASDEDDAWLWDDTADGADGEHEEDEGEEDEFFTGIKIIDGQAYGFYYGEQMVDEGWRFMGLYTDTINCDYVYIDKEGHVAYYYDLRSEEKAYLYQFRTAEDVTATNPENWFELCRNKWMKMDDEVFYFNADGMADVYYDGSYAYELKDGYWTEMTDCMALLALDGEHPYLYYVNYYGRVVTSKSTWIETENGSLIYSGAGGYITIRLADVNGYYYYQTYDYTAGKWNNYKKKGWRDIYGTIYYFNANGRAIRKYENDKCYDMTTNNISLIKNKVALISTDGKTARYYYITSNGYIYSTKSSWIKVSNSQYVYNSAGGYITIRAIYSGGYWKYQTLDYSTSTWNNYKKKGWRQVYDKYFYFTANGVASRYFNGSYCYNLSKGKMTLIKNSFALVGSDYMYFTANGRMADTGVYKQGNTGIIYTCDGIPLFWKRYVNGKWYNYRYNIFTHKFVYDNSVGVRVSETAMEHLKLKYVWGGENLNTGVDCSGLVVASYKKYGVSLPHKSTMLMSVGKNVKNDYRYWKPGDIMARDGHARMYVGNGCVIQTMSGVGVWVTSGWYNVEDYYVVRRVS